MCLAMLLTSISSSTSRLILPKRKETYPKAIPLSACSGSKYASTEGRFSIIDEKCKESTSADSDSSEHSDAEIKAITQNRVSVKCYSPNAGLTDSAQAPNLNASHMTTSGSRFKIVPIESRYKRGRWACWDYYGSDGTTNAKGARTAPSPLNYSNNLMSNSLKGLPTGPIASPNSVPATAPTSGSDPVTFAFDLSDESDAENEPASVSQRGLLPDQNLPSGSNQQGTKMPPSVESAVSNENTNSGRLVVSPECSKCQCANGGRITPSEMLHNYGLERSLSATSYNDKSILELLPGTAPPAGTPCAAGTLSGSSATGPGPGGAPQMVAIDSKIEQAMDLVKTHLMFAVREEVEVLRAKIIDLETTVLQLEAENAILREHVPADILNKLSVQSPQAAPPATASG